MTSTYTCITCRVAFRDLEVQRQHYKSDWHRYNLKRKVAELPPITVEEFQRRVIAQRSKVDEESQSQSLICKACKKNFNTKNQYDNHLLSKKHKEKTLKSDSSISLENDEVMRESNEESTSSGPIKKLKNSIEINETKNDMEVDSDVESVDSDEWLEDTDNPVVRNDCLFCHHHSKSWVKNLKHMTTVHSFFIPDPEFCIDIKGLLIYLGEKVFAGYMCVWCNDKGKAFRSAEAARTHMLDKGHCKMLHEGEALAEYASFYDYSSSYPDSESADPNAEVEIPELDDSDYQLVLPSGSIIGHRSLMRYYKQSLNPQRALAVPKNEKLKKVLSMYRALGWKETQVEAAKQKALDIKYMQRLQQKYSSKLGCKANKLQSHFRQQVNF
ncbi:cytoplasmic 60S subunit biogenesis factor ZNF622 [Phymastichus coffea]|uniref:cytoplasmic 60S subunit biogenesis factor ZNF622 n=1 Tax=Phymastichus coffea TaxID=108790 RepID=UPI00273BFCD5|nr:cytoplasmic 60S subunit biogenesis factor ZNF622 [Phymastichus coffea]XP_058803821.1 cytoplasmic 60S subunit biogenesis factor ZNF622 [Phymastichus coffea]XP_058803822.1 cytoplasmic 60S subunit biogenesis factor ZNF622 [Phymastichus coffea]XP_058803823.1 cytoplasmic 60S subunit biogenesis factor ZNF622 [Phymastichus coffea]XP_058803824.1 cytoplasmic 60S subunit biogenesis factor ZNF622 [Phymastichus coffea]XP_058803825.1 cytoplasmic 60S subunit biogenesis factor ZNF622 [Phymastichus coffea]